MDFGIAKISGGPLITQAGTFMGTAAYMSPEQARGESVDLRTDIWSLGVILYEMLTGRLPFPGETAQGVIHAILYEEPAPLREPGSALITDEAENVVYKALAKDPGFRYPDCGELVGDLERLRSGEAVQAPQWSHRKVLDSVAVFDFANLSGDAQHDWLSGGIAETVSVDLKKIASLKVVSREQVLKVLGGRAGDQVTEKKVIDLGHILGVKWIVWGGYQKMGDSIRITSHFTEVSSGDLVGSAKVDGVMSEIFRLQDRIITSLMGSIELEISDSERLKIETPETVEVEAYEYYAKGRHLLNQMGKAGMARALEYFEKAVRLDPDYALAYSGLGNLFTLKFIARSDPADLERGIKYLQKALGRDPDLTDPYLWLTYGYTRKQLYSEAIEAGQKAVDLDPDHPLAHYFLGVAYHIGAATEYTTRHYPTALEHYRINASLQPNYQPAYQNAAWIYLLHGRYAPAERLLEKAVGIEQSGKPGIVTFVGSLTMMGNLWLRRNRLQEARHWYAESLTCLEGSDHVYRVAFLSLTFCGLAEAEFRQRNFDRALELYAKAQAIIKEESHGLGLGFVMIKILCGKSQAMHELGMLRESKSLSQKAGRLTQDKTGYDFSWIWEGSDAQARYDLAALSALCQDVERAKSYLDQAVSCGWADMPQLEADERFTRFRELAVYREIVDAVQGAQPQLPEYPDF
jgi:TolB-like protein/Flp pilus assembly protein TadD